MKQNQKTEDQQRIRQNEEAAMIFATCGISNSEHVASIVLVWLLFLGLVVCGFVAFAKKPHIAEDENRRSDVAGEQQ